MTLEARLKEIQTRCEAATPERWVVIPEACHYQVSNMGRVRSLLKPGNHKDKLGKNYRVLKQSVDKRGYHSVGLKIDYTQTYQTRKVHRLVGHAFCVGKRTPDYHVAHLDGDPSNNKSSNLKICTAKENNSHKKKHGTNGEGSKNPMAKLQDWQIDEIRFLASKSIPQGRIANLFDIDHRLVNAVINKVNYSETKTRTDVPMLLEMVEKCVDIFIDISLRDYVGSNHEKMRAIVLAATGKDIGEY